MRDRLRIPSAGSRSVQSSGRGEGGVVVGMSGGVDSSIAAWILREQGYRVVGVTLRYFCLSESSFSTRTCCNLDSIERASEFCRRLGIPHHTVDVRRRFKDIVVKNFVEEYRRGRTPNPCVVCNEKIKFPSLAGIADRLGFGRIATGHYARLVKDYGGRRFLASALDRTKDQTYFLYRVPVRHLTRCIFPIGEREKRDVRLLASRLGLKESMKVESQDVCFIPPGGLRSFISGQIDLEPGDVVNSAGRTLGRHGGISLYTIGQRKGLGISCEVPLYVQRIDAEDKRIVLSPEEGLYSRAAVCRRTRLRRRYIDLPAVAKIRYRHRPAEIATIERRDGRLIVIFREPQRAVTPGQSIVLYHKGMVMGGGIIESSYEGDLG